MYKLNRYFIYKLIRYFIYKLLNVFKIIIYLFIKLIFITHKFIFNVYYPVYSFIFHLSSSNLYKEKKIFIKFYKINILMNNLNV